MLGGSWVVISGVIGPLLWVIITIVTLLMTPLITTRTTHEPPSVASAAPDKFRAFNWYAAVLHSSLWAVTPGLDRRIQLQTIPGPTEHSETHTQNKRPEMARAIITLCRKELW